MKGFTMGVHDCTVEKSRWFDNYGTAIAVQYMYLYSRGSYFVDHTIVQ